MSTNSDDYLYWRDYEVSIKSGDGSESKIMTQVGSGQPSLIRFGKFPLKSQIFQFLPFGSKSTWLKGGSASYLLQVKSTLRSGQGLSLNKSKAISFTT